MKKHIVYFESGVVIEAPTRAALKRAVKRTAGYEGKGWYSAPPKDWAKVQADYERRYPERFIPFFLF